MSGCNVLEHDFGEVRHSKGDGGLDDVVGLLPAGINSCIRDSAALASKHSEDDERETGSTNASRDSQTPCNVSDGA